MNSGQFETPLKHSDGMDETVAIKFTSTFKRVVDTYVPPYVYSESLTTRGKRFSQSQWISLKSLPQGSVSLRTSSLPPFSLKEISEKGHSLSA